MNMGVYEDMHESKKKEEYTHTHTKKNQNGAAFS